MAVDSVSKTGDTSVEAQFMQLYREEGVNMFDMEAVQQKARSYNFDGLYRWVDELSEDVYLLEASKIVDAHRAYDDE